VCSFAIAPIGSVARKQVDARRGESLSGRATRRSQCSVSEVPTCVAVGRPGEIDYLRIVVHLAVVPMDVEYAGVHVRPTAVLRKNWIRRSIRLSESELVDTVA
jgi:hypothetical protein